MLHEHMKFVLCLSEFICNDKIDCTRFWSPTQLKRPRWQLIHLQPATSHLPWNGHCNSLWNLVCKILQCHIQQKLVLDQSVTFWGHWSVGLLSWLSKVPLGLQTGNFWALHWSWWGKDNTPSWTTPVWLGVQL